jgi:hypothetical protein
MAITAAEVALAAKQHRVAAEEELVRQRAMRVEMALLGLTVLLVAVAVAGRILLEHIAAALNLSMAGIPAGLAGVVTETD